MLNDKKVFTFNYGGKELVIETNRLAKQADGSVLVSCEGTQVLVTVCSAREMKDGQDFFPLLVEYTEKFYAAGKFLGGFMKREGRPTQQETLNARLLDRPLRPLFPEGYMFDTVVSATVMSYSPAGDPEILAGIGASAALTISDIPFNGPLASARVGRIGGQFVLNPTLEQLKESDLEIAVAATSDAILMVEGEAKEVPEADVLAAINFGHDEIKKLVAGIKEIGEKLGRKKRVFIPSVPNKVLMEKLTKDFASVARDALSIVPKLERQNAVRELEAAVASAMKADHEGFGLLENDSFGKHANKSVDELLYNMMRADILKEEKRIGGRKLNQVREIETETNVLVSPHGSALFTRGETQVLATVTIGGASGEQMSDRIVGQNYDKFYLHYNFPPYSVGEARGVRGVGRRELGHGNLAERALKAVIPAQTEFSYTARVVCEVLESNGSSSMGSVCAGSMALMDAGVPIKSSVAGIAMGLVTDGKDFKILTDILGDEDHLGDMDFKIAGTKKGVTAIQMDIKISGLTREIMEKSIEQALEGRLHILGEMEKTINSIRAELKPGVPRIETYKIDQDRIGALIGPGGKNIKKLQEEFGVSIEVAEDGTLRVIGTDPEVLKACVDTIALQITGPQVGAEYDAVVVTIKEYGAFVDIVPGVSGLVHVSEVSDDRVNDISDYVSEGDVIRVKVVEVDRMGRLKLSAKAVKALPLKAGK